ncbi:MAG: hypothetical protein HZA06_03450 [Nitrospirae bacterium]|nr:hypothetical protein [Nitrospirota bacterium]
MKKEEERISAGQVFYDDLSLLFLLGMVVPAVIYLIWGVMEFANAPTVVLTGP